MEFAFLLKVRVSTYNIEQTLSQLCAMKGVVVQVAFLLKVSFKALLNRLSGTERTVGLAVGGWDVAPSTARIMALPVRWLHPSCTLHLPLSP